MLNDGHKIVMCGCHVAGKPLIESLIGQGIKFSSFVTLNAEQAAKYGIAGHYDFSDLGRKHGIPVYIPQSYSLQGEQDVIFFRDQQFDLLVQGGWQRLFPEEILSNLKFGAIGGHGSADFLPKGRGRSPMNWSLVEGKKRFILQLFIMKPGPDDGDVIAYEDFDINDFDDIKTLYWKSSIVGDRMLLKVIPQILDGTVVRTPQVGIPSHYPKRNPEDGCIDWEKIDVWEVHNLVRASTKPYPGAYANVRDKKCRIWSGRVFDTRIKYPEAAYGEVVSELEGRILINCRGGLYLAEEFEFEI